MKCIARSAVFSGEDASCHSLWSLLPYSYIAQRLVADADREKSDAGTVPKVYKYVHECVFSLCKAARLKTKALTPDLLFL